MYVIPCSCLQVLKTKEKRMSGLGLNICDRFRKGNLKWQGKGEERLGDFL
jgi:hypothetical protein